MTIYLSLLICLLGLVVFVLAEGKAAALGKDMFWVGLLAFLLGYSKVFHLFGG